MRGTGPQEKIMGQYYRIVNLDKKLRLDISPFNNGAKFMEFACSQEGAMLGLAVLLADGNGRGGGDLRVRTEQHPIVGSWAGDRIVICGVYADPGNFTDSVDVTLYEVSSDWPDVSMPVILALNTDPEIKIPSV